MDSSDQPKSLIPYTELLQQLPETKFGEQTKWSNGKYRIELFPEGYIALNKELATGLHPKVAEMCSDVPIEEVDIKLAKIAAYCGILLDGTYTLAERDKLCFILAGRLEVLREIPAAQNIILN